MNKPANIYEAKNLSSATNLRKLLLAEWEVIFKYWACLHIHL